MGIRPHQYSMTMLSVFLSWIFLSDESFSLNIYVVDISPPLVCFVLIIFCYLENYLRQDFYKQVVDIDMLVKLLRVWVISFQPYSLILYIVY